MSNPAIDGFFEMGYRHGHAGETFSCPTQPDDAALEPFCKGYARGIRDANLGRTADPQQAWDER